VRADVAGFAALFERHVEHHPCHFAMVLYNYRRECADPQTMLFPDPAVRPAPPACKAPCTSR
jgi:hypothetical protein